MFNLMFCRRAGAQRPPPLEKFQDELRVLVKQFSKVAANYAQQKSRSRGQAFSAQSRELANSTCVKLKEAKHSRSVWSVVPASYILGKATLAPVSVQATSKHEWDHSTDDRERLYWTLPWVALMGKDRTGSIYEEEGRAAAAGGGAGCAGST